MERWCPNISQCPNVTSNISVSVQQVVCCKLVQLVTTEASDLDVAQTQLITTNTKKLWAYPQTKELRPTLNSPELSDSEVVITMWSELWTLSISSVYEELARNQARVQGLCVYKGMSNCQNSNQEHWRMCLVSPTIPCTCWNLSEIIMKIVHVRERGKWCKYTTWN